MSEENQKWLDERKKYVGASEISTVIKSECTEEEIREAMGDSADEFIKDKPFLSAYMLYNFKKELAEPQPFSPILSEFGHEMEKAGSYYLNSLHPEHLKSTCQKQEVIKCPELHKLASYTPDIFINFKKSFQFNAKDVKRDEKAVCENKTNNLFNFIKTNSGVADGYEEVKFQYIIQNQYQLWIQNKIDPFYKWGIINLQVPKEIRFDNDYIKGKAVVLCQNLNKENLNKICEYYSFYIWTYPIFESLHKLFKIALDRWQLRLKNNIEPMPDFEKNGDIIIQKDRIKKTFKELMVYAQKEYGADENGIIKMTQQMQEDYQNLSDELKIDKQNREDKLFAEKAVDKTKSKMINIFLKTKCLGFDFDTFTIHLTKSSKGSISLKNNFKTSEETLKGITKINKIKEDFLKDATKDRFI